MTGARRLRFAGGFVVRGLLALAVSACGPSDAPGPDPWLRIEISGNAIDKPWPVAGFHLRSADGRDIPLALAVGQKGEGPVLEGRGAPGDYVLVPPEGWRAFGAKGGMSLRAGVPPMKIGVGRTYCIYVWPPQGRSISAIRCSRLPTAQALVNVVDVESLIGDDGAAVLKVPVAEWTGALRVHAILGPSTFARVVPVMVDQQSVDGEPFAMILEPADSAEVAVRVVRADAGDGTRPIELMASIGLAPMKIGIAVPLDSSGRGVLEEVPRELTSLSLFVRGEQVWDGLEAARLDREVRLFVATQSAIAPGSLDVHLLNVAGDARPTLQVRPVGGASYAVPSFTEARDGDGAFRIHASLPPGRYAVLVTCGGRAAVTAEPVDIASGKPATLDLRAVDAARLRVSLTGGVATVRSWDLAARRIEGDLEVEGQGLIVRGIGRSDVDLELPPGRYRVRAIVGSTEGPAADVDLSDAGTNASIDLRPRK